MKTGIYYYQNAFHDMQLLHTMIATLKNAGIDATPLTGLGDNETLSALDALVVLGGDGTMLPAAVASGKAGIPVVGINYGRLGFLTELECGEWEGVVDLLLRRDARIERRSAIEVMVRGKS
ncbi:MAG: NAD(+)/NADH kinase, partial [Christensenellaceae bacterium]